MRTGVMHAFVNHEMTQGSDAIWLLALHLLFIAQVLLLRQRLIEGLSLQLF